MDELWLKMYNIAKKYYENHNNLNVPTTYVTEDGYLLGKWIACQRKKYKIMINSKNNNLLTEEQIKLLNEIHFIWDCEKGTWEQLYLAAKDYYEKNGDLAVPPNYVTETGFELGNWLSKQRIAYKNKKKNWVNNIKPLTEEQIIKLEKIEMIWDISNNWLEKYAIAKEYYKKNHTLIIPKKYTTKTGFKLGLWLAYQRDAYKKNKLSNVQINLLNKIEMPWNYKTEDWYDKYLEAKKYFEKNNNLDVPRDYITETGFRLGNWIKIQKEAYKYRYIPKEQWTHKLKPLTDEQVELLENIGIIWNTKKNDWLNNYEAAKEYYKKNGNLDVPRNYITPNGVKLGDWIQAQRQAYKGKKEYKPLTEEQIKMLESIGMMWERKKEKWEIGYLHALEYYKKNGNLLPTREYIAPDGFKLGYWVIKQRYAYSNIGLPPEKRKYSFTPLTEEQIKKLEKIGMIWNVHEHIFLNTPYNKKKKKRLEKMFLEYLKEYIKENKQTFDNYEDVLNITNGFMKSLKK